MENLESINEQVKLAKDDAKETHFKLESFHLVKARQDYKGKFVEYAGGKYEVMDVVDLFGCLFVAIYDEPPSKHVDMVKLSSVKLAGGVV